MTIRFTLWGDRTGNCIRVAVALHEAGLPFEERRVLLSAGEHHHASFRTLNPLGKVPLLQERTSCGTPRLIAQSNAILLRIASIAPGTIVPTDITGATLVMERYFFVLTDVIGPAHAAFRLRREGKKDAADWLMSEAQRTATAMEHYVKDTTYVGGDAFSVADIAAFTILESWETFPWKQLPALSRWRDRVATRPAIIAGGKCFL